MTTALVNATSLNLRDAANGAVVAVLPRGTVLNLADGASGDWVQVSTANTTPTQFGWVSARFIAVQSAPPPAQAGTPPADDAAHPVTVSGDNALGPDGKPFARRFKAGFFTSGQTTLRAWLSAGAPAGAPSASVVRAVQAVSQNEGRLEAVNTYDNAHLSFGMFQWTAGAGGDPGELAGLLNLLRQSAPAVFQDCFGQYGLDVDLPAGSIASGNLRLNGQVLGTGADKEQLRQPPWVYRFWRAGQFAEMRLAELGLAAARIGRFADVAVNGFPLRQWLSSEYGIALVLDEHVNRPGHVPGTLIPAIAALPGGGGAIDPTAWTRDDELGLISQYVQARATTTMTDPDGRAARIASSVSSGALSEERGSFQG